MKDCNSCRYRELTIWEGDPCERCKNYDNWKPEAKLSDLWDKFMGKRLVVNCQTEEEAKKFLEYCDSKGLKWNGGDSLLRGTLYQGYGEETCYTSTVTCGNKEYFEREPDFEVVTYSEMFGEGKEMKIYKLEEIVKMVRENPNLEIEGREPGEEKFAPHFFTKDFINKEFRIVQQEVPFLEAAKAYDEGKTIRCELNGVKNIYDGSKATIEIKDQGMRAISSGEILIGKWFVEDAE